MPLLYHYNNLVKKEVLAKKILNGEGGSDFYIDEGLMKKLLSKWEEPDKSEIDVWHIVNR